MDSRMNGPVSSPWLGDFFSDLGKTPSVTVHLSTQEYYWYHKNVCESRQDSGELPNIGWFMSKKLNNKLWQRGSLCPFKKETTMAIHSYFAVLVYYLYWYKIYDEQAEILKWVLSMALWILLFLIIPCLPSQLNFVLSCSVHSLMKCSQEGSEVVTMKEFKVTNCRYYCTQFVRDGCSCNPVSRVFPRKIS